MSASAVLSYSTGLVAHVSALKAATDFAFDAGAYCRLTMAREFAADNCRTGCDAFLAWNKTTVNGKLVIVPRLLARRQAEQAMCPAS